MPCRIPLAWRVRTGLAVGHWLIERYADRRLVISHPRSGSTWLRTMLVHLFLPSEGVDPDVVRRMIPGAALSNAWLLVNRASRPRIFKSHTWFRGDCGKAVYLVRDGRDAVVSLYHYLRTRRRMAPDNSFSAFLTDYLNGRFGYLWHRDVLSWLDGGRQIMGDRLLPLRFEDLKDNTSGVLQAAADFLGVEAGGDDVAQAVQACTLDRLRAVERERRGGVVDSDASFYRSGKVGEWSQWFSDLDYRQFLAVATPALRVGGYDI